VRTRYNETMMMMSIMVRTSYNETMMMSI
jgi:hypothetical protein